VCVASLLLVALFSLIACAGVDTAEKSEEPGSSAELSGAGGKEGEERKKSGDQSDEGDHPESAFRRTYEDEDVFRAVAQYNQLMKHVDYFSSYVATGNPAFEDFIVDYFGMERGPFRPGRGTVLTVYGNEGAVQQRISRVFLGEAESDASAAAAADNQTRGPAGWWRIKHETGKESLEYEVHVNNFSVPDEVRFVLPQNGKVYSRSTRFGESVEEAKGQMSDEEISARLEEERSEKFRDQVGMLGMEIERQGEEFVTIAGENSYAVHYSGTVGNGSMPINLWYSPDVTGNLLRMSAKGQVMVEVTSFLDTQERMFGDDVTEPFPQDAGGAYGGISGGSGAGTSAVGPAGQAGPAGTTGPAGGESYSSEGSKEDPVRVDVGSGREGSVGPGGRSYYYVELPYRCDLFVRAEGHTGSAELYSYRDDAAFSEWYSSSSGSRMEVEHYYQEAGKRIYFSVQDIEGDGNEGEGYFLYAEANPLLDSLGVRMKGEYRQGAEKLSADGTSVVHLDSGELEYYAVSTPSGGDLEVTVRNLQEGRQEFRFVDVGSGSYGSMQVTRPEREMRSLRIGGIGGEDTVYFYAVAAPESEKRMIEIRTEFIEK
jgi:hypothetical protein